MSLGKEFSKSEKIRLVSKVFWDKDIDKESILDFLEGQPGGFHGDRINFYCKLLMTYDWYTLLKLVSVDRLKDEIITDEVIDHLFPADLKEKYKYVQKVLFRKAFSSAG